MVSNWKNIVAGIYFLFKKHGAFDLCVHLLYAQQQLLRFYKGKSLTAFFFNRTPVSVIVAVYILI
jgi:hypothetical protein